MDGSPVSPDEHRKVGLHDFVTKRFAEFDNVTIVCGSVPASLSEIKFESISFLHLDMNSYQAEIGALEYLWDFIPTGGVIVLDDFGLVEHRKQMQHELSWFAQRNCNVLELPTGQAIILKNLPSRPWHV